MAAAASSPFRRRNVVRGINQLSKDTPLLSTEKTAAELGRKEKYEEKGLMKIVVADAYN